MACAPSKDSDQPGHPPSLIRVLAVHMKKHWVLSYPLSAQQRLGKCRGWSESSLGAHSFCWFCHEVAQMYLKTNWTASRQNQCAQRRLRSACASCSLITVFAYCGQWVAKDPRFLHADNVRLWSDWMDSQADLSLRLAHMSFCPFCQASAQFQFSILAPAHWGLIRKPLLAIFEQQRCRSACASQRQVFSWRGSSRGARSLEKDLSSTFEPPHDKTNKMACAPSEDSDSLSICPVWSECSLSAQ